MEVALLEDFWVRAFSLLSIAGLSGFCQVRILPGTHGGILESVSLLAGHSADRFIVAVAQGLHEALRDEPPQPGARQLSLILAYPAECLYDFV